MRAKAKTQRHQMSYPEWIHEWARRNDPLGRSNSAPFLREVLTEVIAQRVGAPIPVRKAPPKPKDPYLFERGRQTLNTRWGDWSINQDKEYDPMEQMVEGGHPVTLVLHDAHRGNPMWEINFAGVKGRLMKIGFGPNGLYRILPQKLIEAGLGEFVKYVGPEDYP